MARPDRELRRRHQRDPVRGHGRAHAVRGESIATVECFAEGVLRGRGGTRIAPRPAWTGVLQHMNGYEGDPAGCVTRARYLADRCAAPVHATAIPGRRSKGRRGVLMDTFAVDQVGHVAEVTLLSPAKGNGIGRRSGVSFRSCSETLTQTTTWAPSCSPETCRRST